MEIKKIGVLGAGTMGLGITQICAQAGYQVVLRDIDRTIVEKTIGRIGTIIQTVIEKGQAPEATKDFVLNHIKGTTNLDELADCNIVIETIVEVMDIKQKVYTELDEICRPSAIFASNTSSLSITELAAVTERPEQVIGMHFFNPPQVTKLVEVVTAMNTSEETVNTICDLARKLGKTPIKVKESPGYVVNRILTAMMNEAVAILGENLASVEDIDTAMKLGANLPMGPMQLADMFGLDIALQVSESLFQEYGLARYHPHPMLKKKVRAGHMGMKSGRGFYDYSKH